MNLILTNNKERPGEIELVDRETEKVIGYSKLELALDHMQGPQLRAIVTLPISSLPIFNIDNPVEIDADLFVEISGRKYRITPADA